MKIDETFSYQIVQKSQQLKFFHSSKNSKIKKSEIILIKLELSNHKSDMRRWVKKNLIFELSRSDFVSLIQKML